MKILITLILLIVSFSNSFSKKVPAQDYKLFEAIKDNLQNNKLSNPASSYLAHHFRNNEETMLEFVKYDGMLLQYGTSKIRKNRDIALAAVEQNGLALEFIHMSLKKDRDLILAAASENFEALQFVATSITRDKDFILKILKNVNY